MTELGTVYRSKVKIEHYLIDGDIVDRWVCKIYRKLSDGTKKTTYLSDGKTHLFMTKQEAEETKKIFYKNYKGKTP